MKVSLIDADSIIYIVGSKNAISRETLEMLEGTPEEKEVFIQEMYNTLDKKAVLANVDSFVVDILHATEATHYLGFLGHRDGSNTFRHKLAVTKPYKGNRRGSPSYLKFWKPIIVEHLVTKWGFIELSNIEADDAVAMCATEIPNSVICSPDKDLLQVPGNLYNYKTCEHHYVEYLESVRRLYTQCLVGDSTDSIPGCPGVGAKSKFLEFPNCTKPEDFHKFTYEVFKTKGAEATMQEQLTLVYMLRTPDGVDIKEIPASIVVPEIGIKTDEISQSDSIEPLVFNQ